MPLPFLHRFCAFFAAAQGFLHAGRTTSTSSRARRDAACCCALVVVGGVSDAVIARRHHFAAPEDAAAGSSVAPHHDIPRRTIHRARRGIAGRIDLNGHVMSMPDAAASLARLALSVACSRSVSSCLSVSERLTVMAALAGSASGGLFVVVDEISPVCACVVTAPGSSGDRSSC